MRFIPMVIFAALIPVIAQAGNTNTGYVVDEGIQTPAQSDGTQERGFQLTKCKGRKCSGPGDTIRKERDIPNTQRMAKDRGGQSTGGGKKGRRHHDELVYQPASLS